MPLAIINAQSKIVENIVVPPEGAQIWFVPDGYNAVKSEDANIGDLYENGVFIKQNEGQDLSQPSLPDEPEAN